MTQNPGVASPRSSTSIGKPIDLPFNPINQLSFLLNSLDDLKTYYQFAKNSGIEGIAQVDHGNAWSMYFNRP